MAKVMGLECTVDDESRYTVTGKIQLPGGASIHIQADKKDDRLDISGDWPKNKRGEWQHPSDKQKSEAGYTSITVNGNKGAEKIASDIEKRFLPAYTALYNKMVEQGEGWDKYYADRESVVEEIAAACPTLLKRYENRDRNQFAISITKHNFYGGGPTNTDIEIKGLDSDKALKILRAIEAMVAE